MKHIKIINVILFFYFKKLKFINYVDLVNIKKDYYDSKIEYYLFFLAKITLLMTKASFFIKTINFKIQDQIPSIEAINYFFSFELFLISFKLNFSFLLNFKFI